MDDLEEVFGSGLSSGDEYGEFDTMPEGFSIEDNTAGSMDAADQWLANQEAKKGYVGGEFERKTVMRVRTPILEESISPDPMQGGMTARDLQLGRISHMGVSQQATIKQALMGKLDGSKVGLQDIDIAAAVEEFEDVTGTKGRDFARQIKIPEGVEPSMARQDIRTAVSMLGSTSGEYLERGPGSRLANNYQDPSRQAKADTELMQAVGFIGELADLYIHPDTKGSEIYGTRRRAVEESLTKRFIDGTFYEGQKSLLPLPNETNITGLVPTMGHKGETTAYTRLGVAELQATEDLHGDALYKVLPSLERSLFPIGRGKKSREEFEAARSHQGEQMAAAYEKAEFARRVLRQQMPTNRDESLGQIRMTGWDRPYGDQADAENARNEAALLDMSRNQPLAQGSDAVTAYTHRLSALGTEVGIDRSITGTAGGGTYGEKELSETDIFVEAMTEGFDSEEAFHVATGGDPDAIARERTGNFPDTDMGRYESSVHGMNPPKQGSKEWLAARAGNITASKAGTLLMGMGSERMAAGLARERLGFTEKFLGNAHTREGSFGEAKALDAFMAGPGKGLTQKEAFFETNPSVPGFGASPDGRLFNAEGASEGLLELKYLTSGSMGGALKKYTPQMQMQMAITGEAKTNFFALNKYTGEYVHEVVEADPDMQEKMIAAGNEAIAMSGDLDIRGVSNLEKLIKKSGRKRKVFGKPDSAGDEARYVEGIGDKDETMTAFDPSGKSAPGSPGSAKAAQAAKEARTEQDEALVEGLKKVNAEDISALSGGGGDKISSEADRAAESLAEFGRATKRAVGVLGELGGVLMGGNQSGMDEVRLAAETGMDVENVRGVRKALELGGISGSGINQVMMSAGGMQRTMNDEARAAQEYTRIMEERGRSNLPGVMSMNVPSIQAMQDMDPQQLIGMVTGMMTGKGMEARANIANIFGMSALATSDVSAASITSAVDESINEKNLRSTLQGIQKVEQTKRDALEQVGELGETAGAVSSVAGTAATVLGSATAGYAATKAPALMSMARGGTAATLAKGLSTAAKATPLALAASVAPMAIRAIGGIQEDSMGDSLLDIAEMTAWGAAAGSVIPGVGTAIGAGAGLLTGLGTEVYQQYFGDDPLPSQDIGRMQGPTRAKAEGMQVNNVDVQVQVSPDLIRTTTDVNGDLNVDEETGLSTGGSF